MDVGIQMVFASYGWEDIKDSEVYRQEVRLAQLADELGFDVLWSAEHHFFDYSFCPDNVALLAYVAGLTSHAAVGTAAVILPWNDPLRVAEKISLLDHLTRGRLRFGIGRGLSRREFAAFNKIGMEESRERFDESASMILEALRTGFIEGRGKYYPQPRTTIRPRPERTFDNRIYAVASSEDSIESAARLNAAMVMFADRAWEARLPAVEMHRHRTRELHGVNARPPLTADFCVCLASAREAEELAGRHMAIYLSSVLEHYEVMGEHFKTTEGYAAYVQAAEILRRIGESGFLAGFMKAAAWGTPEKVLRSLEYRRQLLGSFEFATTFRFGGIPYAKAEASLRLFAREVLPVLKTWQ
jgi:alkanesulfonate monooxygenase SsuD/methylene tetrahydromethanopterin reductase-like flavin-dependent oxidoreductase (luciferase family)